MDIGRSTVVKATPQKRKQSSLGGVIKKVKLELPNFEEECKQLYNESFPSVVLAMGSGDTGQLGLGEDILEKKRPAEIPDLLDIIIIRAGGMHSVCLSKYGKVYTFGCNDEGALGRQIIEDEEAMIPGEIKLPEVVVVDITAGDNHSSILTNKGQVYIWGSFRDNNGTIGLLKPFEKLLVPTRIPIDNKVIKISSGENHFVMLTDSGEILTLGCAEQGQLGRVPNGNLVRGGRGGLVPWLTPGSVRVRHNVRFCEIWAGPYSTLGRSTEGDIYGCGLNNYKQLGLDGDLVQLMMTSLSGFNEITEHWKSFAFGQHHTLALTANNQLFVVGRGEYGSLGLGNDDHQTKVTHVPIGDQFKGDDIHIKSIAACNRTSYALLSNGSVLSWGMGSSYQLGHGDGESDVNVPTKISGKQIDSKVVIEISPGFQHVLFRVIDKPESKPQDKDEVKVIEEVAVVTEADRPVIMEVEETKEEENNEDKVDDVNNNMNNNDANNNSIDEKEINVNQEN